MDKYLRLQQVRRTTKVQGLSILFYHDDPELQVRFNIYYLLMIIYGINLLINFFIMKCKTEIQLKQMAVLLRKQKSIHCHVSYIRIVYMQELPIPAKGLDRCMTIFTRGFHVYGSHCPPQNSSQFIARFPPLTTSTHIYIWKR